MAFTEFNESRISALEGADAQVFVDTNETDLTTILGEFTTYLKSGGALGTPSSGVATNLTGTAAGLTVGATTGVEAGADVTDTANVTAAGALMDSEVTNLAQVKAFDTTDYATAAQGTTADGAIQKDASNDADGVQMLERPDHPNTPAATKGQFWVKSDTPNKPYFTDDAGTDFDLSADLRTGVYREGYINAGAMVPRTTNGATSSTTELATNDIMYDSMDFDTATEQGVGFWIRLPAEWDASTVKLKADWTAASGSGTVKWDFAARAYADSDALDQALGTEQGSTDTLITANDQHLSPATSALTIGGTPVAGEPIYFQVARDVATDTLGVDAQLIGVVLQYKESTTEPSIF